MSPRGGRRGEKRGCATQQTGKDPLVAALQTASGPNVSVDLTSVEEPRTPMNAPKILRELSNKFGDKIIKQKSCRWPAAVDEQGHEQLIEPLSQPLII